MGEVLKLTNVKKFVSGDLILDGVSLTISEGEVIVVRGRSGVGKTTLARISSLIDEPDEGVVVFRGVKVSGGSDYLRSELRLRYIGYVDQFFKLLPNLTVFENVELPLRLLGVPRDVRRERVLSMLRRLGLSGKEFRLPSELSGGERQRVAIARALVKNPLLVVLDEPFSNLDDHSISRVMGVIKELSNRCVGVLITTTDLYRPIEASKDLFLISGKLVPRDNVGGP